MSLLDKATIITTPTAHSEGKLHSIKGGAVADFDVVRGSAATRVNAEGLIEDMRYTTGNLVDYSTLTPSSSAFSLNGDGKYVFDNSVNAFLTTPAITANVGDVFNVLVDMSVPSGGDANFRYTKGNAQTVLFNYTDFPDGVTEFQAIVTGVDGYLDRVFYPASLNDGESTLNRFEVTKVVDDTNIPRLDYTDGTASILLEPQSTNSIPYSEDFTQSSWIKDAGTTLTLGQSSPDGGFNAYKVEGTIGSSFLLDGGFAAISTQSRSIYMRADTNGAVYSLGDGQTNQINLTTEWKRFELQESSNSYYAVDFRGVGVTLDTVYIYGAQLEALPYATSYIPTNGTATTRLADAVTGAGDASTFNDTEGVLYFEGSVLANSGTSRFISISDGSTSNRVALLYYSADNRVRAILSSGGTKFVDSNVLYLQLQTITR